MKRKLLTLTQNMDIFLKGLHSLSGAGAKTGLVGSLNGSKHPKYLNWFIFAAGRNMLHPVV